MTADIEQRKQKAVSKSEAPVMCYVESGSVSVIGYRRTLFSCTSVREAVMALLSLYFVFSIEYDGKQTFHELFTICPVG